MRNGIVPDGQLVSGVPRTEWVYDAQGVRCTRIMTDSQIISLDFHYEATCYLNELYSPSQPVPVGKMIGLWTRDLFEMKLPFHVAMEARQRRTDLTEGTMCAICLKSADAPFELDHVSPRCYDGERGDKQWLCARCNHGKSNRV